MNGAKCDWCGHELTILDVEFGGCICGAPIPLAIKEFLEEAFDQEEQDSTPQAEVSESRSQL